MTYTYERVTAPFGDGISVSDGKITNEYYPGENHDVILASCPHKPSLFFW